MCWVQTVFGVDSRRCRVRGFTLVELMIVVVIIAVIAAITVPNLLSSKKTANQSSAIGNLRNLATAQETYATTHNSRYADSFDDINFLTNAANTKQVIRAGYNYYLVVNDTYTDWYAYALAVTADDGDYHYFVDKSSVIRHKSSSTAVSNPDTYASDPAGRDWTPIGD